MRRYVGYGYGYYRCYFASGLFACPEPACQESSGAPQLEPMEPAAAFGRLRVLCL